MAGLIKGQILKHLSKFVLNLNPNQISLSALKGEGELSNLELNCAVLTELLELPVWVRLVQATCNRAAIRIQWTKLKTVPIQLSLDEIRVKIETCEDLRGEGGGSGLAMPQQPVGNYGFTQKVVDGISMSVNLVHVTLTSLAFTASFQMSRIVVESKSPSWQKASLPHTRLKDLEKGEVLVFKELSWQTVRIEARSTVATDLTPLRLITNQARVRITLKKRMSDCGILGVRLVTILDDLLWVLTDDQLKAALHFVGSVSGLVKKATEETQKVKAARKLDNSSGGSRKTSQPAMSPGTKTFAKYDVTETSYHFYSDRIDLHFCDDPGGGRSKHPELQGGGAFQVSLAKLQVDYYPYHLARGDRKHWVRYSDTSHRMWLQSNLSSFDTKLLDVLLAGQNKTPLSRGGRGVGGNRGDLTSGEEGLRDLVVSQLSRLMTTNIVVRLADLTLWRVSTSSSPSGRASQPQELLKGDCARLHLPPDLPLLHMELTQFYYPGDLDFPLPPPCLLLTVNPVTVWLDILTFIWLNSFTLNLQKSVATLQESLQLEQGDAGYADVKVELVMPRIICSPKSAPRNPHTMRPSSLQISASKVSLSNYRSLETGSRADLATALDKFQQSSMFFGGSFPCNSSDPSIVCEKFWSHATGMDCVRDQPTPNINPTLAFKRDLLWTEARDVWYCSVASVWAEFTVPYSHNRPIPLLDATPLSLWIYAKPDKGTPVKADRERPSRRLLTEFYGSQEKSQEEVGVHVLALASQLVSLQLDHYQLLFLLRLAESLSEMGAFLSSDSVNILHPMVPPGMVIGAVLPQLDMSVILPGGGGGTSEESFNGGGTSASDNSSNVGTKDPVEDEVVNAVSKEGLPQEPVKSASYTLEPVNDHSDPLSLLNERATEPQSSHVQTPLSLQDPPVKLQLLPSLSNGSSSSQKFNSTPTLPHKSKGLTSSFNSMLDGLGAYTGYKSSPDPYLSLPHHSARSPDCDLDSLSVRSDESGESNWQDSEAGWTMVSDSMDIGEGLFKVDREQDNIDRGPSPAEEVLEGLSETGGVGSLDPVEESRIVTVLTLHLGRLALAQISGQKGSSILLDATSLATSIGGDQDYQQFQFRFGQSGKTWSESTLSPPGSSAVKIRLDSQPPANPSQALAALPADLDIPLGEKIARVTSGLIEIEVTCLVLSYTSSVLTRLGEWAQDEIIATPIPMAIKLSDLSLHLTDDAPPPPGCPPPPPIDLSVPHLTITRDKLGMFSVSSTTSTTCRNEVAPQSSTSPSQVELDLRSQLDTALAEVRVLRARLGEGENKIQEGDIRNKELSTQLDHVRKQMDGLMEEKKSLLDTLRYLQEELLKSGKK